MDAHANLGAEEALAKIQTLQQQLEKQSTAFDEFQSESRELEQELDREISAKDEEITRLRTRLATVTADNEEWKDKYRRSVEESNTAQTSLQREVDFLRSNFEKFKARARTLEQDNDDLERHQRIADTSMQDLEGRYGKVLERNAVLESELEMKAEMEVEMQRLKDELRDVRDELSIRTSKGRIKKQSSTPEVPPIPSTESLPKQTPPSPRFHARRLSRSSSTGARSTRSQSSVLSDMMQKVKESLTMTLDSDGDADA